MCRCCAVRAEVTAILILSYVNLPLEGAAICAFGILVSVLCVRCECDVLQGLLSMHGCAELVLMCLRMSQR